MKRQDGKKKDVWKLFATGCMTPQKLLDVCLEDGKTQERKRTMKDWSGHQGQRKTTTTATPTTISTLTSVTTARTTTTRKQN